MTLDDAIHLVQAALPRQDPRPYGWASDDGTVILFAPGPGAIEREGIPALLGALGYAKITPDGTVTAGTYVSFWDDIHAMHEVGAWPADDDGSAS